MRTIQALLKAPETVLESMWKSSITYTLLINELLQQLPHQAEFPTWQRRGWIDQEAVRGLIKNWKQQGQFTGLAHRWYLSAELVVKDCYDAWFAQQRNRILSLEGKQKWLDVLLLSIQLVTAHSFSEEHIFTTAQIVLQEAQQTVLEESEQQTVLEESEQQTQGNRALLKTLLDQFKETTDALIQCAIVYLIVRQYEIGKPMLDAKELQKLVAVKKKEIERLEQQLKAQFPKGRDPLGHRFEQEIDAAIAGPIVSGDPQEAQAELEQWLSLKQSEPNLRTADLKLKGDSHIDQIELEKWINQKQIRLFEETPYPLKFGSGTDVHWSKEPVIRKERSCPSPETASHSTQKPKKRRSKRQKRRTAPEERICVAFHSMTKYKFHLFCGHRQLPYFNLIVNDYFTRKALRENKFDAAFLLLRSATLIWVKNEALERSLRKQARRDVHSDMPVQLIPPWLTHQLYLHCAIDDEVASAEGVEKVRQKKIKTAIKSLKRSKKKNKEQRLAADKKSTQNLKAQENHQQLDGLGDFNKENCKKHKEVNTTKKSKTKQESRIDAIKTTLRYLHQPGPNRPSQPVHQKQDHLVMGISFNRKDPIALAVVDCRDDSMNLCCSTEELLLYHQFRLKRAKHNLPTHKLRKKQRVISYELEYRFLINRPPEVAKVFWMFLTLPEGKLERTGHRNLSSKLQYTLLIKVPQITALPILLLLNLDVANVMNDYCQIIQLHEQHQATVQKRSQQQKNHRYQENSSEANAREHTARVIAAAIVALAIELQVGQIVLPELSGIRERVEALIRAEAEAAHPHHVEAQNQYAKEVRASFHRWNYRQLATAIEQRAARAGLSVRFMPQPVAESALMSAYSIARSITQEAQPLT
jgi:IS605 OrfB family transposase